MQLAGNAVLITGGSTGIGLAMAQRFAEAGSEVIACGRRQQALDEARLQIPGLQTIQCDVSIEDQRLRLLERVRHDFPKTNVLVNNAGIQNRPAPMTEPQDWAAHKQELATNLEAPMHLSMLFIPFLQAQQDPAIINVTSGLAFVPMAGMPTYCATKAALHSFTLSLRRQLKDAGIEVIEMAPPAVQTDLGGKGLHTFGVPLDEYADFAMVQIAAGETEFGYQFSARGMNGSAEERRQLFEQMNSRPL
jgi:uncharacterized oxidoreductase